MASHVLSVWFSAAFDSTLAMEIILKHLSLYFVSIFVKPSFPFLFVQTGRAKDPVKFLLATEQRARERQVAYETVRLLREDVIECYRKSGINHYTDCKEVNQKYFDLVTQKDMGQLHPKWKNEAKHDGW